VQTVCTKLKEETKGVALVEKDPYHQETERVAHAYLVQESQWERLHTRMTAKV